MTGILEAGGRMNGTGIGLNRGTVELNAGSSELMWGTAWGSTVVAGGGIVMISGAARSFKFKGRLTRGVAGASWAAPVTWAVDAGIAGAVVVHALSKAKMRPILLFMAAIVYSKKSDPFFR